MKIIIASILLIFVFCLPVYSENGVSITSSISDPSVVDSGSNFFSMVPISSSKCAVSYIPERRLSREYIDSRTISLSSDTLSYGSTSSVLATSGGTPTIAKSFNGVSLTSSSFVTFHSQSGSGAINSYATLWNISGDTITPATPTILTSALTSNVGSMARIDDTNVAILYASSGINVVIATSDGSSLSLATPKLIFATSTAAASVCRIDPTHIFISYYSASKVYCVIGTIAADKSITLGTVYDYSVIYSNCTQLGIYACPINDSTILVASMTYRSSSPYTNSNTIRTVSISNGVISGNTPITFDSGAMTTSGYVKIIPIGNNYFLLSAKVATYGLKLWIIKATGTTVEAPYSTGSVAQFLNNTTEGYDICMLGDKKFAISILDAPSKGQLKSYLGAITLGYSKKINGQAIIKINGILPAKVNGL